MVSSIRTKNYFVVKDLQRVLPNKFGYYGGGFAVKGGYAGASGDDEAGVAGR